MAPMSIFDQRATRMWGAFADRPNLRPYDAIQPAVVPYGAPGYPVNPANAPMAAASAAQDFSAPDRANEATLNRATRDPGRPLEDAGAGPQPRRGARLAGGGRLVSARRGCPARAVPRRLRA